MANPSPSPNPDPNPNPNPNQASFRSAMLELATQTEANQALTAEVRYLVGSVDVPKKHKCPLIRLYHRPRKRNTRETGLEHWSCPEGCGLGKSARVFALAVLLQRLSCGEVALDLQERAEVADGEESAWVPIAECLAPHLQRLTQQRLSGGEVTLHVQQHAEVVDGAKRVRVPTTEGLACHLQHLAAQRLSGGEVALLFQQYAEVVDRAESARMPIAERRALHLQRLT
eukprot:scaffold9175_cov57-Phaeocystis_antarctica.AAC.7